MGALADKLIPSWNTKLPSWLFSATGSSPSALIGAVLDGMGVTPPGTEGTGLKWSDLVGTPSNLLDPAPGQSTTDAGQVVRTFLGGLFPPFKYLDQDGGI